MGKTMILTAAVFAGLALCACEKEPQEPASAPPAAATGGEAAALPVRKPGLWQQTITVEGAGAPMTSRVCLDAATDAKLSIQGQQMAGATCSEQTMTRTPGGYSFSSTCSMPSGGSVKSSGVATGDFNSGYEVKVDTATTGAAMAEMNRATKMAISAKWEGECPAGWTPGDVELPGGTRVNTLAMLQAGTPPAK